MSLFPGELEQAARLLLEAARERRWRIATAESCTGGLVAGLLTEIAGSSDVVDRGFVTYSNRAKADLLGVPADLIADQGAVSEAVARSMAEGAIIRSDAHLSIAITGVAGPGGGTALKPVGLVHFATACANGPVRHRAERFGNLGRSEVRLLAVKTAIEMLRERLP
ncbi:CinA family protein [soil metagenome]